MESGSLFWYVWGIAYMILAVIAVLFVPFVLPIPYLAICVIISLVLWYYLGKAIDDRFKDL